MSRPLHPSVVYADAALEAWARWAHDGMKALGWPPVTILARLAAEGFHGAAQGTPVAELPEGVERTEKAVLRLPERERRVVVAHYLHWEPIEASARRCRCSVSQFRQSLNRARREVAAFLEGFYLNN